jgi:hypothetical protein
LSPFSVYSGILAPTGRKNIAYGNAIRNQRDEKTFRGNAPSEFIISDCPVGVKVQGRDIFRRASALRYVLRRRCREKGRGDKITICRRIEYTSTSTTLSNVFRCAGRLSPMLFGKKQRRAVAYLEVA